MTRFSDLLGRGGDGAEGATTEATDGTTAVPAPDFVATGDVTAIVDHEPLPVAVEEAPTTSDPVGRDVFAELAAEQVVHAEQSDATTERLRALGLEELPAVDDDFLPRR